MEHSFQIGDVVYLNSGSPPMTVTVCLFGVIKVTWMIGAEPRMGRFPYAALTKKKPKYRTETAQTPVETAPVLDVSGPGSTKVTYDLGLITGQIERRAVELYAADGMIRLGTPAESWLNDRQDVRDRYLEKARAEVRE